MTDRAAHFYLASSLWLMTSAPWPRGREVFMNTRITARLRGIAIVDDGPLAPHRGDRALESLVKNLIRKICHITVINLSPRVTLAQPARRWAPFNGLPQWTQPWWSPLLQKRRKQRSSRFCQTCTQLETRLGTRAQRIALHQVHSRTLCHRGLYPRGYRDNRH
jgi:hypothetical protein